MADEEGTPEDQQEGLEDLGEAGRQYQAVINQADWTVETIIQQIDKGNIELNPSFQRREAWRNPRKSQYIESLILNVPVPQVVLAERRDARGKFIVIDGKQRLLALRQFHSKDDIFPSYPLSGLSIRTDLNGTDYEQLSTDFMREQDHNALENSTIRTAVIRNWGDETFLYTVFLRLNTGSVPLSPQELRQALHPGEFVKFIDEYSRDSELLHSVMGIKNADPRMRDAELVIRYFAFRNFLQTYTGNLKPLLDDTAKHFNRVWEKDQGSIQRQKNDFESTIKTTIKIFGEANAFRKWSGAKFERPLNRAVFDVMTYHFTDAKVRKAAEGKAAEVVETFKLLCDDESFVSAVEGTTKSIEAIFTRLRLWGEALRGIKVPAVLPTLENNKITHG
ncbi:hypothetical protein ES707_14865 [subsurface metagenome]